MSEERPILGSVFFTCFSDLGRPAAIRHLVIAGSPQWLVGCNVTRSCNQFCIQDNRIQFSVVDDVQDYTSIVEDETYDYIQLDRFSSPSSSTSTPKCSAVALSGHSVFTSVWSSCRRMSDVTRIVHRVYEHVCGHALYGDTRTLLQRNNNWNDDEEKMLSTVDRCSSCTASTPPPPN